MKIFVIILGAFLAITSCSSQVYIDPVSLSTSIEKKEFTYNATSAFPMNGDVIGVLNSLPGSAAGRVLNLDPGYGFNLKKDLFSVHLPYFGRAYNINPGEVNKSGLQFESKDFSIKQSQTKKSTTLLVITPNDQKANFVFNLEIFKNGSAFLSVNSNDRQPISFDGNISANK